MYKIQFLKAVKKDLRKLPSEVKLKIMNFYLPLLAGNPYQGTKLYGRAKGYFKYFFRFKGTSYRII